MAFQTRYSFKKVAAVTGIICVFLVALEVLVLFLIPTEQKELQKLLTWHSLIAHLARFSFLSVFYYVMVNKFYLLIIQKKTFSKYLLVTVAAILAYGLFYCISIWISPEKINRPELTVGLLVFTVVMSASVSAALALLIAYLTSLRDEQKQRKILEKQKMELEIENSQANFNFLKAQINPHFLHNTLNFFYAKALPLNAELSEGILCLSDIMRYALNEGGKDEKALLKDEIEHLENVIKINQFRFNNRLNVRFEVTGIVGGAMIVPFVLITLVENAFKHGDIKNSEHPIVISLVVEGKRLYFSCSNKKNPGKKEISTGIGLPNILKRLDIMYGNNYTYKVTEDAGFYSTELIINAL